MKFGSKFLKNYIIFLCLLPAAYCLMPDNLHAQEVASQGGGSPVDDICKVKNLSLKQCQALKAEMAKTGGQLTPDAINSLKKSPEFKDMAAEKGKVTTGAETGPEPGIDKKKEDKKKEDKKKEDKKKEDKKKEDKSLDVTDDVKVMPKGPKMFAKDFFYPARSRILMMEKMLSEGTLPEMPQSDALTGFVGPLDMASSLVNATVPANYMLNPQDAVIMHFWGDNIELVSLKLTLDEKGEVGIPKVGRLIARGMTLLQFQDTVKKHLERFYRGEVKVIATLDRLKSIQIFITGEAFHPGSYAVSSVTTLFNALNACGGPNDYGSLREIKLIRNNKTLSIDFYDYLLRGDGKSDYPLLAGDTIFISKAKKLVSIDGEVYRPAIYEMKEDERFNDLIRLANGLKPTAMKQKIQIVSVIPNKERVIVDIDITKEGPSSNPTLIDGDEVMISSIPPTIENMVTLEGKVERPGNYELKKGMRLSDLFTAINPPSDETYLDKADVIRVNKDMGTTTLISIDLGKALAKEQGHDILLSPLDRVIVYSKRDLKFLPPRRVIITGAVQRPGDYERSDGMRVKDLLFMSGGVLPNAYLERADLLRYDFETEKYTNIAVNIKKVLEDADLENIIIQDRDYLTIYTFGEKTFTPEHSVSILGSVQRPDNYVRFEGMRVKDLLDISGGVLPGAHDKIEVARARTKGKTEIIVLTLSLIEKGDENQNVQLQDGDIVAIMSESDFFEKPRWINVKGEVKSPGVYALYGKNDRISDIIDRAGGVTEFGYKKGTVFKRKIEYIPSDIQKKDTLTVNRVLEELNVLEYDRQVARNALLLQKESGSKEAFPQTLGSNVPIVTSGTSAAQAAAIGMAPSVAQAAGQTVAGAIDVFGPLPGIAGMARKLGDAELTQSNRIVINIEAALQNKGGKEDLVLMEGDTIIIPQKEETVSVIGAVMRPTTVHFKSLKYMDYIKMSGDYTDDANIGRTLVMRVDGSILPAKEVKAMEPGDIIYVPTKVMTAEIVETADKVIGVIKYALTTIASVVVFITLLHMF